MKLIKRTLAKAHLVKNGFDTKGKVIQLMIDIGMLTAEDEFRARLENEERLKVNIVKSESEVDISVPVYENKIDKTSFKRVGRWLQDIDTRCEKLVPRPNSMHITLTWDRKN